MSNLNFCPDYPFKDVPEMTYSRKKAESNTHNSFTSGKDVAAGTRMKGGHTMNPASRKRLINWKSNQRQGLSTLTYVQMTKPTGQV